MDKLHILFVEDNPFDAELLVREIKKGGLKFDYEVVDSLNEAEHVLSKNSVNFLISDYSLPGFTGIDVIQLIKSKELDIPVILVSGTVPDEKAIDAVLMGAKDYVLKDNLSRLVSAIKREMESLAQREERQLNELFLNSLFDSFTGIRISDRNRKIVRVNDTYCAILGYERNELEGASLDILTPVDKIKSEHFHYENFFNIGKKEGSRYKELKKDGSFVELIVSSHVIEHKSGQFVLSTFQDVTDIIRDNTLFERVSKQANIGGWERDLKTGQEFWTKEIYNIYGISEEKFNPSLDSDKKFHTKESWALMEKTFEEAKNGIPFDVNVEIIDANNVKKWCRGTGTPVYEGNEVIKIIGSFQDITDQKEKELILEESKQKYQYLFESNPNPLLLIEDNNSNRIIGANPAAISLYGYTEEEFLNMTSLDIRPKEEVQFYLNIENEDRLEGRNISTETTRASHQKKNGEIIEVDIHWKRIELNGIESRLVLINDVTDKAKYERELKQTNTVLSMLIDHAPIGVITINRDGIVSDIWNEKAEEIFGWKAEETYGKFLPFVQDEFVYEAKEKFRKSEPSLMEIKRRTKDGRLIILKNYLTPIKAKDGKVEKILLLLEDITEQTKIEQALVESEQKYRNLVEASHDLIWRIDREGKFNFINTASLEILGYSPEELMGEFFAYFVSNEMADEAAEIHSEVLRGETFENFDLRMITKKGKITFLSAKAYPLYDNSGKVIGCSGTATDITSILEYQSQLEESLVEKEVLIKEIHHRVKNNLAVISGLFALQAMTVEDEEIVEIFNESQARIKSIATIHEKLYQNELFTSIEVNSYLSDLLEDIRNTYKRSGKDVKIELIGDEVTLNVNQAVPFGILANELITNSFKYAFPDNNEGQITLSIKEVDEHVVFQVKDNGVGFPEDFENKRGSSLGVTLIESLASQLNGEISWKNNGGAIFELTFKPVEMKTWQDKVSLA